MERCHERVYDRFTSTQCQNPGKVEDQGHWYCGVHNPVKRRAKQAAEAEQRRTEQQQRDIIRAQEVALATALGVQSLRLTATEAEGLLKRIRRSDLS